MEAFGRTVLLFFALFVFAHPARASCVHPAGLAGCFTTIHAAVDAALPGETIEIDAGSYVENVVVDGSVGLVGVGPVRR